MSLEQNFPTPQYQVRGKWSSWNPIMEHKVQGYLGFSPEFLGGCLGGPLDMLGGPLDMLGGPYFTGLTPTQLIVCSRS